MLSPIIIIGYSIALRVFTYGLPIKFNEDLPIFPDKERMLHIRKLFSFDHRCSGSNDRIPCYLWITGNNLSPNNIPPHISQLIDRNIGWSVNLFSHKDRDKMMKKVFNNTQLLWAYSQINPALGAATADIWRMAVLFIFGGVYIDLDADITIPLRQVILPNDTLIISTEHNNIRQCYVTSYRLYHSIRRDHVASIFSYKVILQWLIFAEPEHIIIEETLKNIIEVISLESQKSKSVISNQALTKRRNLIYCTTGPDIFTASVLETIHEYGLNNHRLNTDNNHMKNISYRYIGENFEIYGGIRKVSGYKDLNGPHYISVMERSKNNNFLNSQNPVDLKILYDKEGSRKFLEEDAIQLFGIPKKLKVKNAATT